MKTSITLTSTNRHDSANICKKNSTWQIVNLEMRQYGHRPIRPNIKFKINDHIGQINFTPKLQTNYYTLTNLLKHAWHWLLKPWNSFNIGTVFNLLGDWLNRQQVFGLQITVDWYVMWHRLDYRFDLNKVSLDCRQWVDRR